MHTRVSSVAYHEAGHAVAGVRLGMRVSLASIETVDYLPGRCLQGGVMASFDHEGTKNRGEAERAAIAALAGEQAERLWSEQKPWRHAKSARHIRYSGDHAYVEEMLRPFVQDSADMGRTMKRLKALARTLLMNHWGSVEALAAGLAERKVLGEADVKHLVALKKIVSV